MENFYSFSYANAKTVNQIQQIVSLMNVKPTKLVDFLIKFLIVCLNKLSEKLCAWKLQTLRDECIC